ncbi:MAG: hypothetical protein US70_C0024G0001 [Parcubacteria group bacterium GW2011_GWD2_38_11]|nr:MAG: hypothetical protein US70_C0024G0001 [Parcubacteria group bacterium GW2011_GWD2_38_11]
MQSFVIKCSANELNAKIIEVWGTQMLAEQTYAKMKVDKQLKKTMESSVLAKYALQQVLG